MDLKNLCQNFDINSIRARIPSLPAIPVMPQIKLPKSLPKLRSRRIFSRSREDINKDSPKQHQQHQQQPEQTLPPPSDFINHSPRRISTISSLMNQRGERQQSTYRSADSVDDDYPSPRQFHKHVPRPISPINAPISASNDSNGPNVAVAKLSLTERLQKGYKDITEFRLSHIFAKKTVVRRDTIQVDQYVERYNEEREREMAEQEKRDQQIAENYRFKFKVSRQDTKESKRSLSSNESVDIEPRQVRQASGKVIKSVSEHSGDESGMEASPPTRKPEVAAARTAAKMRNPQLQHSMSVESSNELYEGEQQPTVRHSRHNITSSPEAAPNQEVKTGKSTKALNKLRNIGKRSSSEAADAKKRQAPLTPQQSQERLEAAAVDDNAFTALKQNLKRLQKSIKRPQPTTQTDESEGENTNKETKHVSRTEKITSRLRRLTSREGSLDNLDETTTKEEKSETKSPIRAAISNKLQTLKKSFKKKPTTEADATNTGDETSPEKDGEKEKRPDNLMKKLRNIRSHRNQNSSDDLDATEDEDGTPTQKTKRTSASTRRVAQFEEKFEEARKRTVKKVNEKMQQIKFFHKSQDNIDKADTKKKDEKHAEHQCVHEHTDDSDLDDYYDDDGVVHANTCPKIARRAARDNSQVNSDQEEEEPIEEINNVQRECITQKTRTLWTTKNLLSDSLDSETDEFPRVLIHQDNTDQFESTLIIAVTCPAPSSPTSTAIIEEIVEKPVHSRRSPTPTPSNRSIEWIPNTEIISSFLEITPPSKRRLSAEAILPAPRGHARKMSMDSNSDSDSWIPESVRNKQLTTLSKENLQEDNILTLKSIDENEEPWKVHTMYCEEKLYKAKSIDIFEANRKVGGVEAVFDDFEEELRNEPILKVQQRNVDSFEKESSEEPDAADDDNSSRVTKIRVSVIQEDIEEEQVRIDETTKSAPMVPTRRFGSSHESLIVNTEGNKRYSSRNDMGDATFCDSNTDADDDEEDRPPSAAPSPPPNTSPPPPPLPKRKPSILAPKPTVEPPPPPLPITKPPLPTTKPPPQIPERTPSMKRIAKPLVKTSSLRLAYNEQVKPADVGKVNKLISRFEQPPTKEPQRPRLVPRRLMRDESEEYSEDDDDLDYDEEDDDDDDDTDVADAENANSKSMAERDTTPTNTPRTNSIESNKENIVRDTTRHQATTKTTTTTASNTTNTIPTHETIIKNKTETTEQTLLNTTLKQTNPKITIDTPKISLCLDVNSNASLSRASSEYGSPLEYPSSLIGSTETTPIPERRQHELLGRNLERSRRSMTRDDDKFLSFDSDDENSYYSISSSSSSRYVVEI